MVIGRFFAFLLLIVYFKIVSEILKVRTKAHKLRLFISHRSRLLRLLDAGDNCRIYVRTLGTSDTIFKNTVYTRLEFFFGCLHLNSSVKGTVLWGLIGWWPSCLFDLTYRNPMHDQILGNCSLNTVTQM